MAKRIEVFRKAFKRLLPPLVDILLIMGTLFVINAHAIRGIYQFPEVNPLSDYDYAIFILAAGLCVLLLIALRINNLWRDYLSAWKYNTPLLLFIAFSLLSLSWSVFFAASLYKIVLLWVATVVGAYLGVRFGYRGILRIMVLVGIGLVILSLWWVSTPLGVMWNDPFIGSWVGVFWHRNHTGNILAYFSALFFILFLWGSQSGRLGRFVYLLFATLSGLIVLNSKSATGIIVIVFLYILVTLISVWLVYRSRLFKWHYYLFALVAIIGIVLFISNTEFIFALLGRTSNMTGRIPLWEDLFENVFTEKPVLGYGYGALWMQKSFRVYMQIRHGWKYEVFFSDNGFLDILLNLGITGLGIFLWFYLLQVFRSLRLMIINNNWLAMLPFVSFAYVFAGNLTYSFLLEVDQFVWLILIIWSFVLTKNEANLE